MLSVVIRARDNRRYEPGGTGKSTHNLVFVGVIIAVTALAFTSSLKDPFISDSYDLVKQATEPLRHVVSRSLLTHPTSGDFGFRPVVYLLNWLEFRWTGYSVVVWHLCNLLVHTANAILVFILCRQLRFRAGVACVAALLFAVHGARPEAVCWVDARYDLFAFFFFGVALIAALRSLEPPSGKWLALSVVASTLAVLSKESAFCVPLVLAALFLFREGGWNKNARGVLAGVSAACVAVLLYRTWFLQGIGGYKTSAGTAMVTIFHPLLTLKALFFRAPAILFFPINWSIPLGPEIKAGLAGMLICLATAALATRSAMRPLVCSLAVLLVALLPVEHLLLIGPALTGARVLYLPSLDSLFSGQPF